MTESKYNRITLDPICKHLNGGSCINSYVGSRDGKIYCRALIETEFRRLDGTKYDCPFYK